MIIRRRTSLTVLFIVAVTILCCFQPALADTPANATPTATATTGLTAEPTATPTPIVVLAAEADPEPQTNRTTWFVDNSAPAGGNGSESAPFQQIQTALDTGQPNTKNIIMVAYAGGNPYNSITITTPDVHIRPVINKTNDFPIITSPDTNGIVIRADNVTLCRLAVTGCKASFEDDFLGAVGGGILVYECKNTTLKRCTMTDNHAFTGGGIAFVRADGSLRGPVITGNTADNGGGISIYSADLSLYNATTRENSALNGGGLMSGGSKINIHNSNFSENNASNGGGIYLLSSTKGNISCSVVYDNYADNSGGGIYAMMSKIAIKNTTILKNNAKNGGGMYNFFTNASLKGVKIKNNRAKRGGGYEGYHAYTDFYNCDFTNNTAENGGSIYSDTSTSTFHSSEFNNNTAENGGGIYSDNSTSTFHSSEFNNNTAENGGGIYSSTSTSIFHWCNFINNSAEHGGGYEGYHVYTDFHSCNFINNTALQGAGISIRDPYRLALMDNIFRNTENLRVVTEEISPEDCDICLNGSYHLKGSITGSPYFGGNVWAYPNGTGFSVTQNDTNVDGICDDSYTVTNSDGTVIGTDYLPLYYNNSRGTVNFWTFPKKADVLINGISYNRSTQSGYYLPPDTYSVKMTNPGYFNRLVVTTTIAPESREWISYMFNETATGVSAWTWHITGPDGSITEKTGRNLTTVLSANGAYTGALNATWTNKTTQSEPQVTGTGTQSKSQRGHFSGDQQHNCGDSTRWNPDNYN